MKAQSWYGEKLSPDTLSIWRKKKKLKKLIFLLLFCFASFTLGIYKHISQYVPISSIVGFLVFEFELGASYCYIQPSRQYRSLT